MGVITAKQLKQKTGEIIKRIKLGERLTLTYRGKPIAIITSSSEMDSKKTEEIGSFEAAWKDIEATLEKTKPAFRGWREATEWVRKN
jgi:prevent-host-death family protein